MTNEPLHGVRTQKITNWTFIVVKILGVAPNKSVACGARDISWVTWKGLSVFGFATERTLRKNRDVRSFFGDLLLKRGRWPRPAKFLRGQWYVYRHPSCFVVMLCKAGVLPEQESAMVTQIQIRRAECCNRRAKVNYKIMKSRNRNSTLFHL